jgi:hypothetical protein
MQNNNFGDVTTHRPLPEDDDCNLCDYWEWDDFWNRICGLDKCIKEGE